MSFQVFVNGAAIPEQFDTAELAEKEALKRRTADIRNYVEIKPGDGFLQSQADHVQGKPTRAEAAAGMKHELPLDPKLAPVVHVGDTNRTTKTTEPLAPARVPGPVAQPVAPLIDRHDQHIPESARAAKPIVERSSEHRR